MPGPHITTAPTQEYLYAEIGVSYNPDTCPRAFYIAEAGDLALIDLYGNAVTFFNVVPGTVLPFAASEVTAAPANTVALF